jgi:Domain of unknown function (DUF6916)
MSAVPVAKDFEPFVGKTLTPRGQHRVLTLVSVETQTLPGWDNAPVEPFLLTLSGPPGDVLPEGQYEVAPDGGPDFTLYIIPIHTPAPDRQDYQVVFN